MRLAALFMFLISIILTLAPAVRNHTWDIPLEWMHWMGFIIWLVGFDFVHRRLMRRAPDRDPFLVPLAAILAGWGVLMNWRLSTNFGMRQTAWLAICLALFGIGLRFSDVTQRLRRYKYLWLFAGFLLLGLTFFFGTYPDGSTGPELWLGCCGVYLQPSEPLKLLLIAYLAAYMADNLHLGLGGFRVLAPSLILVGAALLLLLAQHDLGTAFIFLALFSVILFIASERKRYAAISIAGTLLALGLGYLYFDVVRLRIEAWLNPWLDPNGRSYQIVQSLIAIASGGIFGRGPGIGSPSLVPVAHSDFIYAAIGEEFGLLGTVALVLILALFAVRGLRTSLRAPDAYRRYLAAGLTTYLVAQALLIIGGNIRLFPLTGVTLPFVSYGGSSLVTSFLSLFLLVQISSQSTDGPQPIVNTRPTRYLAAMLLAGLMGVALLNTWWSVIRSSDIQTRSDNLRVPISEQYTPRGNIVDRDGEDISITVGSAGDYTRNVVYPDLSPVVGYSYLEYGRTGLEASFNPYLRGLQGMPFSTILWTDLLYSQPPAGLDIRLTLDLDYQRLADDLLNEHKGAAILLNADTGEILVMASHPGFDANTLPDTWETLVEDPGSPLINRATLGQYPLGTTLGAFVLAGVSNAAQSVTLTQPLSYTVDGNTTACSLPFEGNLGLGKAVTAGCPATVFDLVHVNGADWLDSYLHDLGFYSAPDIPLTVAEAGESIPSEDPVLSALGIQNLRVSPLQVARAATAISAGGNIPELSLVNAYQADSGAWVSINGSASTTAVISAQNAQQTAQLLTTEGTSIWSASGSGTIDRDEMVSWYIGGTPPDWGGSSLALVVVLEENDPDLAKSIGGSILNAAMGQ